MPADEKFMFLMLKVWFDISNYLQRLCDAIAPAPTYTVGTESVAKATGLNQNYVSQLADGRKIAKVRKIPQECIVPGSGHGKPWKFYREPIDKWIETR